MRKNKNKKNKKRTQIQQEQADKICELLLLYAIPPNEVYIHGVECYVKLIQLGQISKKN